MRGSAIASLAVLVVTGVIIADFLIHPQGTQAAGNALANSLVKPSFSALLGTVPS